MPVMPAVVGEVNHARNGLDPSDLLTDIGGGTVGTLPNGQAPRGYTIVAQNKTLDVVPR